MDDGTGPARGWEGASGRVPHPAAGETPLMGFDPGLSEVLPCDPGKGSVRGLWSLSGAGSPGR